jgi:5-methylcytosine-specific restriction endonuclease McrA
LIGILKRISKKQSLVNRKLKKIYEEIYSERGHYCTGCGTSDSLTHSHIIPRSRRADLTTDKRNITYHCLSCHNKWEGKQRVELMDYERNMAYIKEVDKEYYYLIK